MVVIVAACYRGPFRILSLGDAELAINRRVRLSIGI